MCFARSFFLLLLAPAVHYNERSSEYQMVSLSRNSERNTLNMSIFFDRNDRIVKGSKLVDISRAYCSVRVVGIARFAWGGNTFVGVLLQNM